MLTRHSYYKRQRNEICWCGSGKKSKHCHIDPPPKTAILICGASAAGKSATRRELAARLPEPLAEVDYDKVMLSAIKQSGLPNDRWGEPVSRTRLDIILKATEYIVVSDMLCDNNVLRELVVYGQHYGVTVFPVLLYCDPDIRQQRDQARHESNPDLAHGFLEGLTPEKNHALYRIMVDTSDISPEDAAGTIHQKLLSSIWKPA